MRVNNRLSICARSANIEHRISENHQGNAQGDSASGDNNIGAGNDDDTCVHQGTDGAALTQHRPAPANHDPRSRKAKEQPVLQPQHSSVLGFFLCSSHDILTA